LSAVGAKHLWGSLAIGKLRRIDNLIDNPPARC